MRGVTKIEKRFQKLKLISTHTPHAGSDGTGGVIPADSAIFLPTLPMRGVTLIGGELSEAIGFLPTLPMRGVTYLDLVRVIERMIFLPTPPMRGVT